MDCTRWEPSTHVGPPSDLKHDLHPTAAFLSLLVPLQIEVWLQQVGWPALEELRDPSLDMLLQAQGPFQDLDQVAQVSLVACLFHRYWVTWLRTGNARWVKANLSFSLLECTVQQRRSVVIKGSKSYMCLQTEAEAPKRSNAGGST